MALVHKHKHLTHRSAGLGLQVFDEGVKVCIGILRCHAKLVHQRTQQPGRGLTQLAHQVPPAAGAANGLASVGEHPFDLLIQLVAVGDDRHPRLWVVLQNPLGQQHHQDAFTRPLCVPDDAALALPYILLRSLDAEILVHAGQLFDAALKQHKVVHQLNDAGLVAHLQQVLVQLEAAVVCLVFLPGQKELCGCADGAVLHPFGIVARHDQLHGAEEPCVELGLLVRQALPDAIANADPAVFEFQHANGDAIDVQHQVGPPLLFAFESDFFGNGKVVVGGLFPVDEVNRFRRLARLSLHRYPVAQQLVHGLVVAVQAAFGVVGFRAQLVQCRADLRRGVARAGQVLGQQALFDIAVVSAVGPVAQVAVTQLIAEQFDHAVLRGTLWLANVVHMDVFSLAASRAAARRLVPTATATGLAMVRISRTTPSA